MKNLILFVTLTTIFQTTLFAQDTIFYCDDWTQMQIASYLIENNVWGKGNIVNYTQCIYETSEGKFGWHWDWPDSGYNVKAYPEVIFGRKPWWNESTYPALPLKLSAIESFIVDFDLNMSATGSYNLAFEFWVIADSLSDENNITPEVMIWTDSNIMIPAGSVIATVSFDGFTYNLYRDVFTNWTYFAFLSETVQYQGTLNVHKFINYMVDQGLLNPTEYFASFELGNEVINGNGVTNIHNYEISVNSVVGNITDYNNPSEFGLYQNYPNPFNPSTSIRFFINSITYVKLTVYDSLGEEVISLVDGIKNAGHHEVNFDGRELTSGVYYYRLTTGDYSEVKSMILLK
ncbi:MAG: T9SS type A sorting domain-containing protein [Ignavibacterium sp.]|nr:MAG: T9SS type A sorting domain-containing protein [Ignavibacterium sp.]